MPSTRGQDSICPRVFIFVSVGVLGVLRGYIRISV